MVLRKLGRKINQNQVFDCSGTDPLLGRGCHTPELARALRKIGFRIGRVWSQVHAGRADSQMQQAFGSLVDDLRRGVPSIVCMHYDARPNASEHFRLVLGYDGAKDQVIYHEPAKAQGAYQRMSRKQFLALWPLKYKAKQWTVVRIRMQPGEIADLPPAKTFTNADYAQHVMELKKRISAKGGFTVVIQPSFVVIGDESAAQVRARAGRTVKWAVDILKKDYFRKDPTEILDIWLFRDRASYQRHTWKIFHDKSTTPFGYYSHEHKAMVMNIATGGGTLVHEIVHPFMRSNFPQCPAWFNEGLGSLYEQSRARNGHIVGNTNWRLAGLQKAIRAARVPSFKTLTGGTEYQFYKQDPGTNYSQARYLCYYLQEHGLLVKFYRQFVTNHKTDPTGYETLKTLLRVEDITAFQKQWEAYVLRLRFP